MKRLSIITLTGIWLLLCTGAFGQNISNKGKEFWVGYGHHQFMETGTNTQEMILYLSAEQPATVTVTIDSTTWTRTYTIPANTVIASDLIPKSGAIDARLFSVPVSFGGNGGEGLFRRKGIHIVSNVPIVAYAHIYGSTSSGASMLIPVDAWGYSYTSLNSTQNYASNCNSWFYVIAKHDSTVIEITPTVPSVLLKPANVPFQVTLMKGQIFQYTAALNPPGGATGFNASGSTVKSIANAQGNCYPIAVFSGSSRTSNPISCGSGGGDNDNQQAFPHHAWGKKYLTAPTSRSAAANTFMTNSYRVAVKDPTTVVRRNGVIIGGLTNNHYFFESSTADYIEADKPIMIAQYMTGGSCLGGGLGDPEMIYLSPIEQGIKRIGFYRNTREAINVNYLTLIVPTAGLPSLRVDGSATIDHSYPHPNLPGYSVAIKRWTSAQAQATATCDSAFTAITYGLGSVESYGYNAGTFLKNLNASSIIHNVNDASSPTHQYTCTNTPMEISMLVAYKPTNIVWALSQISNVTPNADVTMPAPVPTDSTLINGIWFYRYNLPGTYVFSDTGTVLLPVRNTHVSIDNCNNTEEVYLDIAVRRKPVADFNFTHSSCVVDTIQFNSPAASGNGYTINQWNWTFSDATTANVQNPKKLFATAGVKNISLQVISAEGCVGDTTRQITIYDRPTVSLATAPAALCESNPVTLTGTTTYGNPTGVGSWYWDYGNATNATLTNNNPQNLTYPGYGTYTIKYVAKVSNLCVSDTAQQTVTVYAKPQLGLTYPAGCLPAGGVVQFNSTTTVPDGQTLNYSWNFGDPAATGANPNTSTLANPTHTYSAFGTYTIQYSVTTNNGCQKDTSFPATFNLRPTFNYPALNTVCESVSGTVSVATATVTNGVPGTGVYKGPGTDASGNFNPAVAGPGSHTIWYVYATTGGCTDSVSQTIAVRARPFASFTRPAGTCFNNGQLTFTNASTISDGQALTYTWNFGDATPVSNQVNPIHNYAAEGTYNVNLSVTTNNGCTKDTTVAIPVGIRPVLNFPALPDVCESVTGTVSVASGTVTNGIAGTAVYRGPGTDVAGNFSPSAAGYGLHTIWYVFTTNGGCKDSLSRTIRVWAKPFASFTTPAGGCFTNGQVNFTNASAIADGQTLTYTWNFGDATPVSNQVNPIHNYAAEGNYPVRLTVTTANGCSKDTTINIQVSIRPVLTYPALTAVCESVAGTVSVATGTVTNGLAGTSIYRGPGTDAAGNFSPSVAGAGLHTIWYVFTTNGGCKDSLSGTIRVWAKPFASFTTPSGCFTNGQVGFTNATTIADGQALTYSWNFGDASPSSGLLNPVHNYAAEGTYNVTLSVNTANGCTKDTTVALPVSIRPVLSFPALTAQCENISTGVSVASATVTNSITGTGIYRGPGTDAAGNFNPSVAGAGTHTIWYVFTTNGGCKDSVSQTITVNPKPLAAFTVNADICLDQSATFTSSSTIPSGSITNWNWFFGDATTASNTNGNAFTKPYTGFGTYTVKLVNISNNGCISDTAMRTVAVHAVPVANFNLPASVCMPNGAAAFTNTSATGDNSSMTYTWDFGDASPVSNNANPSHVYAASGTYNVTLTAVSAFGCTHDTVKVMSNFFDKPVANFNVSPDTLCEGTDNVFQDLSTAPNSTIQGWLWSFGDGNTATIQNPVKRYTAPGNYTVQLRVTNAVGCVSDLFTKNVLVYLQPKIDAGPSFVVPQGTLLKFNPVANDSSVTSFNWSPPFGLDNASLLRPTLTANFDQLYTVTATGQGGCTASDFLTVKILKPVKIPNAFSPNGDGINDTWVIENLADYPGLRVEIFNRYGQSVFMSNGYGRPWDGMFKGQPVPVAVYYYVIDLKNGFAPLTGSVTIIR